MAIKIVPCGGNILVYDDDTPVADQPEVFKSSSSRILFAGNGNYAIRDEGLYGLKQFRSKEFNYSELLDGDDQHFVDADGAVQYLCQFVGVSRVENVVANPPEEEWNPTAITLGSFTGNGVTAFLADGAGHLFTFDPNQNDEIRGNIDLKRNGKSYSGQSLLLKLHWQLFTAPGAGDDVIWELDYAFVSDGEDNFTKIEGTEILNIDVSSLTERQQITNVFAPISGDPGAEVLQLTIRRKGQGAGSDRYSGDVDLYSLGISKTT